MNTDQGQAPKRLQHRFTRAAAPISLALFSCLATTQVTAYSNDSTSVLSGRSTSGCLTSGCHDDNTYDYTSTIVASPATVARNQDSAISYRLFRIASNDLVAGAGGFNASATGGSLLRNGGTPVQYVGPDGPDAGTNGDELAHSTPLVPNADYSPFYSGGNGLDDFQWQFRWRSSASGLFTVRVCGNPVNNGGTSASDGNSHCTTRSVRANDPPVVSAGAGSASYTENANPVTVAPLLAVSDFEGNSIKSAYADVTGNSQSTDVLSLNTSCPGGFSCSYSSLSRRFSISGSGSTTTYRNLLRAIRFSNSSDNPSTSTRTVTFSVTGFYDRSDQSTRTISVSASNDPPIIDQGASINRATNEDIVHNVNLTVTDPDDTAGGLSWSILTQPPNGTASASGTGTSKTVTYTPDPGYSNAGGADTDDFVVRVFDGQVADTITVRMTVNQVDDPPIIAGVDPRNVSTLEDTPLTIDLSASDQDGDTLTWSIHTQASAGTASVAGTGNQKTVNYAPNANVNSANLSGDDSFVVRVWDGAVGLSDFDAVTVNVDITAVNDPPNALNDLIAVPVNSANNMLDVLANDNDNTDPADLATSLVIVNVGAPSNGAASVTHDGVSIIYTPPPDFAGNVSFSYTINDRSNGSGLESTATVTVTPPDADADTVPDFLDNCPDDANANQNDNDDDGDGDACDEDDDNDGMLDADEENHPGCLDPLIDDAAGDCDGDGRSNADEINGGFIPSLFDVAPTDVTVDSTGFLTIVNLPVVPGMTPRIRVDEDDACETGQALNSATPLRPGRHLVYWTAAGDDVCSFDTQTVDVRPLVNLSVHQSVVEGATATVTATLNGPSPTGTVTLGYDVTGTADTDDHEALSTFEIAGLAGALDIDITDDMIAEGDETLTITITDADNAAFGSRTSHTLTIAESNLAPTVDILVSQNGNRGALVIEDGGTVTITALAVDGNGDSMGFDWSASDAVFDAAAISIDTLSFEPASLVGVYSFEVTVTDGNGGSTTHGKLLTVVSAVTLDAEDTDGDGDDDVDEGFQDSDNDGVPEHLDSSMLPAYQLQTQTGDPATMLLLETEPGLTLSVGDTARRSMRYGVWISEDDLDTSGGASGSISAQGGGTLEVVSTMLDFTISGANPGDIVRVVLPLPGGMLINSSYHKYTPVNGWTPFVEDAANSLASTASVAGLCPGPADPVYSEGLTPFDDCVLLRIEDGGPNDADGLANGVVVDPGAIVASGAAPAAEQTLKQGSALQWAVLFILTLLVAWRSRRFTIR